MMVIAACLGQLEAIRMVGGRIIMMASRALARGSRITRRLPDRLCQGT